MLERLEKVKARFEEITALLADPSIVGDQERFRQLGKEHSDLTPLMKVFDAYRKAIDCLRPGDVVLCTTHAAFRPRHVEYAVEKGMHVFMEKTFAPDPGGVKRILRAGEAAEKKNLKIAAGVMCRHSSARQALIQKIRDGAMGDIQLIRAYRMDDGYRMGPFPGNENELLWQIRRPVRGLVASCLHLCRQLVPRSWFRQLLRWCCSCLE